MEKDKSGTNSNNNNSYTRTTRPNAERYTTTFNRSSNYLAQQQQQQQPTTDASMRNASPGQSRYNAAPNPNRAGRHAERQQNPVNRNKYIAIDCEMVGTGPTGQDDMLARVSIVNIEGDVLLDKFVRPQMDVTDYRTSVSGIRPHDMANGDNFIAVQNEVIDLINGKVLVGHAIFNDLAVLRIRHPMCNIRDTSLYKPLSRHASNGRTPSLKKLALVVLGQEIQTGEHNSVEDARAAMGIYNRYSTAWEKYIEHQYKHHRKM